MFEQQLAVLGREPVAGLRRSTLEDVDGERVQLDTIAEPRGALSAPVALSPLVDERGADEPDRHADSEQQRTEHLPYIHTYIHTYVKCYSTRYTQNRPTVHYRSSDKNDELTRSI